MEPTRAPVRRWFAIVPLLVASAVFADASPPRPGPGREARWLALGLPLVASGPGGLRSARDADCGWVKPGSRFRALDAVGAALGDGAVKRIDGPGCVANFGALDERAQLFQSSDAPAPQPSARWSPSAAERAAFRHLASPTGDGPADRELLFFVGAGGARFAAAGGRHLVIARLDGASFHVFHSGGVGRGRSDRLLAAIDLDGDGTPEVVSQHIEVDVWQANVFRFDGTAWRRVASGLGGDFA